LAVTYNVVKNIEIGKKVIFQGKDNEIREGVITYTTRDDFHKKMGFDELYPDYSNFLPKVVVYCSDNKRYYSLKYKKSIIKI
jgi:ASC-1-like (ASCH) protein